MPLLEITRVTKKFSGLIAVNEISMNVESGQIVGVIGPNGAGKTTLFNCIAGALPPTSGSIVFDGKEISGKKPYEICRLGVTRTFQVVKPFASKTVLYNTMVGAFAHTKHLHEAERKALKFSSFWSLTIKRMLFQKV